MDDFTQAAIKKYTELKTELRALEDKKVMLEGQLKGLVTFLQGAKALAPTDLSPAKAWPFPTEPTQPKIFFSKKDIVGKEVEKMLKMQQPQITRDLLERLGNLGITIGGNDPVVALSAILSRDSRFVASRKDGWSLREKTPDADDIEGLI